MRTSALWLFPAVSILIASSPLQAVPTHQWSKSFGDASTQNGRSTAVDPSGNVLVTGDGGGLDFGGGPLPAGFFSLVKFDSDGNHLWSKSFGGDSFGGEQRCLSVAADGSGNVVITGYFFGTIDFGGGLLASGGGNDVFLAKFDPSGNHLWSKQFGEPLLYAQGSSIAVDGHDRPRRWCSDQPWWPGHLRRQI
jgi:hypothetical protein